MEQLGDGDVLMVISDHGFSSFRRGVNLNSWLRREGYLVLKDGADGSSRMAARRGLVGDAGLLPRPDRHVPEPARARSAGHRRRRAPRRCAEGRDRRQAATGCATSEQDDVGISEVFDTATLYAGPYLENAPDLLIGYNAGYRTSWDCATGVVGGPGLRGQRQGRGAATTASIRGWCRACSSATAASTPSEPALIDIAPTALRLFGIEPPPYMDGRPLAWWRGMNPRSARMTRRAGRRRCVVDRVAATLACSGRHARLGRRVIVLGFDGLDYDLTRDLMARGRLPNFARLAATRQLRAARHVDPAAESGRLVHLHHRPRSRRPRHLRLRPSRSEDDDPVPVDDEDRGGRRDRSSSADGSSR